MGAGVVTRSDSRDSGRATIVLIVMITIVKMILFMIDVNEILAVI